MTIINYYALKVELELRGRTETLVYWDDDAGEWCYMPFPGMECIVHPTVAVCLNAH